MTPMPVRIRRGPLDWLAVALPVLLAALLCAYRLGDRSLWLDEGASVAIASQHGAALWHGIAHDGGNMLIYYLALHVVIAVFGDGEVALRMISLLADAATAGLVAMLALRLFASRGVAVVAGVLSAVSVSLIFWGQDARGYAVMVTATAASFYALVVLLDSDSRRAPPVAAVLGYVLATAAALYIGFDAILIVPAQLLLSVMLKRRLRVLIGSLAVVAVLCVPLLVLAVHRGSGQLFWVPPLSLSVLWQTLATLVSAGLPPNFHTTTVTIVGAIAGSAVTLISLVIGWRARWDEGRPSLVLVPVLWLAVPAVIGVAASAAGEPVELARISILLMPALSLLVAWVLVGPRDGLAAVPGRLGGPNVALGVGLTVLIAILVLRVAALLPSYHETPEPWKQVTSRVLAAAEPKDCIAFYPQDGREPFGYYVKRMPGAAAQAPRSVLPDQPWSELTPHVEQYQLPASVTGMTQGCDRIWLVSSHQGQAHGPAQSRRNDAGYLAIQRELAGVYHQQVKSRYGYASAINVTLYSR
jgi:mannosyltransferase